MSLGPGSKVSGRNGRIYFGGFDASRYSNKWSLTPGAGHIDVGGFLENFDSGVQSSPNWSGSISGFAKGGHSASITTKLFNMLAGGDYPLLIYPEDYASGKDYWYAVAHISSLGFESGRKDALGFNMSVMPGVPGDLYHFDLP